MATLIGIMDFTSEDLRVCFTSSCVNDAISRLKFPLAIASLAFPLVALVASHHRSAQTAAQIKRTDKQIEVTEHKNAFENYFKHRTMFNELLGKFKEPSEGFSLIYRRDFNHYSCFFELNSSKFFVTDIQLDDNRIGMVISKLLGKDRCLKDRRHKDLSVRDLILIYYYELGIEGVKKYRPNTDCSIINFNDENKISEINDCIYDVRKLIIDFLREILDFGHYEEAPDFFGIESSKPPLPIKPIIDFPIV